MVHICGYRETLRAESITIAPVRLKVQRNEMHAAADALFGHQLDESIAIDLEIGQLELQNIQMPGMDICGLRGDRSPQGHSSQFARIAFRDRAPPFQKALGFA